MGKDLTQGPILRTVLSLSIPMTWGMMSVIAFNIADTYFIGQLGKTELAAMSLTFPVVMIFFSLALGMATAVSSVVARSLGENNLEKVRRYTSDGLSLGLIIVFFSIVIGFQLIDPVFTLLGANEETLPMVHEYMEVWLPGMIFLTIPMAGNGALRAAGEMKIASTIMFVAALTNIILDPIFIFGLGFIPAFGIKGAAMATVISRAVTLVASLYFLHFKFQMIDWTVPKLSTALESWKKIMHIAIPTAGTNLLAPLAMAVATGLVARIGEAEIAAYGVVNRVESFSLIYIYALSSAVAPIVGQNYGAKEYERVKQVMNASYLLCFFWCVMVAAILILFRTQIISVFNESYDVVAVGSFYLLWVPISFGFLGIRLMVSSFYNAIGKPAMSVILGVINLIVLFIPLVILGAKFAEMLGVIGAHFVTNLLIGIISWIMISIQIKRKNILQ